MKTHHIRACAMLTRRMATAAREDLDNLFAIRRRTVAAGIFQFILHDFVAESISMDPQYFGRFHLVATGHFQYAPQESLLQFRNGILEKDAASDHLVDQIIEALFHLFTLWIRPT